MKSVALHNLGCKVNAYELDVIRQILQEKGYRIVPFDQMADIYIINTCTVTNIADRKSRQMLHRAKKQNPRAVVVAVGCYVQTGQEQVLMDSGIDLAIGNNKKKELPSILEDYLRRREKEGVQKEAAILDINDSGGVKYEEMTLTRTAEHTRAYIKIQDGCNQFCSYCIIPYVRGRVRSRREEDVLREVAGLVRAGYREVVLTGIHISSYGMDIEEKDERPDSVYRPECLLKLIGRIQEQEGLERIRLGSLEPRIITPDFVEKLRTFSKVCPHFHLSLQSGCDATLKRMNRHYLAGEYYEKTELLRRAYDNPAITTDVIVGFPGETEEEFKATKAFLQKVGFYEMHVFKYSPRKGTRAALMENQISADIKAERSDILIRLSESQSRVFRQKFLGQELSVLLEEQKYIGGKAHMIGHTGEYVKVALQTEEDLSNRMVTGNAEGFLAQDTLLLKGVSGDKFLMNGDGEGQVFAD